MKLFKKSTLSLAMTAAMIGGVAMTAQQANALPLPGAAGNAPGAPYVSANGLGQALVYPYYTVREGFTTNISVFNTSSTHAVAVKVRFREYQNSRDVLDFNLVLSPNDKWSGTVSEDGSGVKLTTSDTSCTVPAIPAGGANFSPDGYSFGGQSGTGFQDTGSQNSDRMKAGYAEIIPMAWADAPNTVGTAVAGSDDIFAGALHAQPSGVPANCATVISAFTPSVPAWNFAAAPIAGTVQEDGRPSISADDDWEAIPAGQNPLFGETIILNTDNGVAGGTNAVAIADWMTAGVKLTTAQEFPYYLEPTLATSAGLWDTSALPLTDAALTSATIYNEWANNPNNGANVDWVVTMPTKSFHADQDALNVQAGSSNYRNVGGGAVLNTPLAPFENAFGATGTAEMSIDIAMYNNEEGTTSGPSGSVSFSPGSFSTSSPTLKYEANTITFGGDEVLASVDELALDPANDIAGGRTSGYMALGVPGDMGAGLPMVGFAAKQRDTGNASLSFGQLLDHKWGNPTP